MNSAEFVGSSSCNRLLLLAMANLGSHASLLPSYFSSPFSCSFRSHLVQSPMAGRKRSAVRHRVISLRKFGDTPDRSFVAHSVPEPGSRTSRINAAFAHKRANQAGKSRCRRTTSASKRERSAQKCLVDNRFADSDSARPRLDSLPKPPATGVANIQSKHQIRDRMR